MQPIQADSKLAPPIARQLGYAGILPFAALALIHAVAGGSSQEIAVRGFLAYGAVILSFIGGIRWGVATRSTNDLTTTLPMSVVPSLWAFVFLMWPGGITSIAAMMLGFILMGIADWLIPGPGSAAWMRLLRIRLSLGVFACHVFMIVSIYHG